MKNFKKDKKGIFDFMLFISFKLQKLALSFFLGVQKVKKGKRHRKMNGKNTSALIYTTIDCHELMISFIFDYVFIIRLFFDLLCFVDQGDIWI